MAAQHPSKADGTVGARCRPASPWNYRAAQSVIVRFAPCFLQDRPGHRFQRGLPPVYVASQESSADSQGQADLSLINNRLRELEEENAEPERQEALRRRKKQLKEVAGIVEDRGRSAEDKIAFLLQRVQQQVCKLHLITGQTPLLCGRRV